MPFPRSHEPIDRRTCLRLFAAAAALAPLGPAGCGNDDAESGDAYAPWHFPGAEPAAERIIARAALLAANPHNTQPWSMRVAPEGIDLFADPARALGTMDPLLREMHIGLGCAVENMVIAARVVGRAAVVALTPDPAEPTAVAALRLAPAEPVDDRLFSAIARRHTNRGRYVEAPPALGLERALRAMADGGVSLHFLAGQEEMARFRAGTLDATCAIADDAEMSRDTNAWYRQSNDDIQSHRDGVTIDATGNGALTRALGKMLGRPSDETMNRYWIDATAGDHSTATAFCILSTAGNAREDQLRVGRVYQRMHLWAVTEGLAMQPLNQMAERQDREETRGLPPDFATRLEELMDARERRAQMLFRVGYAWDDALASPRRPLEWVLR